MTLKSWRLCREHAYAVTRRRSASPSRWASMATTKAARPPYLPAWLIGGLGEPDTGRHVGHRRYSWVCALNRRDASELIAKQGLVSCAQFQDVPANSYRHADGHRSGPSHLFPVQVRAVSRPEVLNDPFSVSRVYLGMAR